MKSFLARIFSSKALPGELTYEAARAVLEQEEAKLQEELASRPDAEPEMLYYLAEHATPEVRRAVAANGATPALANLLLSGDGDTDVRVELARKVGRLLPNLDPAEKGLAYQQTMELLARLAADNFVHVRAMLAEEIKSLKNIPQELVMQLARDVEEIVAAPILEYSPLLSDRDLIDIVASARAQGAVAAVARRRGLSEDVSAAIVATLDVPAVTALLANKDARVREESLEELVSHAEEHLDWHAPLVARTDLPIRLIRRIAGFVSSALIEQLAQRQGLEENLRTDLVRAMRMRLEKEDFGTHGENKVRGEVLKVHEAGALDDVFVETAVEAGQRETVVEALALLAGATRVSVEKILASRGAKAVTALAWRAGLPMRVAFKIQTLMLKLTAKELLPARAGVHYPLTDEDMRWQLSYFGIAGK